MNLANRVSTLLNGGAIVKRDLETVRYILGKLDSYNDIELDSKESYHLQELIKQELVTASGTLRDGRATFYQGLSLTWNGHELLAAISNEYVWETIKEKLQENGMTVNDVPVSVINKLSEQILIEMFGTK